MKDRNEKRITEHISSKKLTVLFDSTPTEFRTGSVLLDCNTQMHELPNDFVWIFAGGTPPSDFLKAAGVAFGSTGTENGKA